MIPLYTLKLVRRHQGDFVDSVLLELNLPRDLHIGRAISRLKRMEWEGNAAVIASLSAPEPEPKAEKRAKAEKVEPEPETVEKSAGLDLDW